MTGGQETADTSSDSARRKEALLSKIAADFAAGRPATQISADLGYSRAWIRRLLRELGLPTRQPVQPPLERILGRTAKAPNGCWLWQGPLTRGGYANTSLHGKVVIAHRAVYILTKGKIPDGLEIDHTCHSQDLSCPQGPCDHRRCLNPDHLEAVTTAENHRRSNVRITHCPQDHEYTPENSTKSSAGSRVCLICERTRKRICERKRQRRIRAARRGMTA